MMVTFWKWNYSVLDILYVEGSRWQLYFDYSPEERSLFIRVIVQTDKNVWQFGPGLRLWPLKFWVERANKYWFWYVGLLTFEWMKVRKG